MPNWVDEANEIRASARLVHIKILVWGPGDPGSGASDETRKSYEKRIQIRQVLRSGFPRAEVYFSEDSEMMTIGEGIIGQLRKEALQARNADLVLMLDIGRGADLELDHFVPTYSWFREKVYVFLPEEFVPPRGLVKEVFDYLRPDQVEGFTDQEFEDCDVATQKAVRIAETLAVDCLLHG
ncbi:MAG: hypothetical protein ACYS30_10350 [Planctomycetota bacterium]|jgi:hypothetical protein